MPLATIPCRLARTLSAAFVLLFIAGTAQAQTDLVITGVVDGPLSGGTPKAVELYALNDIADLGLYAVGSANNGGGTDGPELVLSGSATAGDFLYVASESDQFEVFFGFTPDFVGDAANINGDDAIELFYDDDGFGTGAPEVVVDTFGELDVDGTGQPWEYLDGWAYRTDSTGPDGTAFAIDNWTFSGPDALDGETTNDGAATPFPVGAYDPGDGSSTPVVTFTESSATVTEGNAVTLTVRLDFPNDTPDGNPVTVTVAFDAEASTADEADFDGPTPVQVTFDGTTDEAEQSVTVTVIGGDGDEGDEVAVFEMFVAGGIADLGAPATFTLAIEDSEAPDPARVQVIHNAADPLANLVDISIVDTGEGGDGVSFDDVPFRAATPFFDLAPGTYQITVTDEEDLAVVFINETITVASGETVQLIANGVVNPDDFEPNPDGQSIAAELFVNADAQEVPEDGVIEVNIVQGATDASMVNLGYEGMVVPDLVYGDISPYVDAPPFEFGIGVGFDNISGLFGFPVDFSDRFGETGTLLVSGFTTPDNDQDGSFVGLLIVFADGTTTFVEPTVRTDIAGARALPLGTQVTTEGVVTRAMGDFTRMQDETGGITIRQTSGDFFDDVADGTIAPGTELRMTGTTSEFNELLQVNDGDLMSYGILGSTDVPEPQVVTLEEIAANGEGYESELIRVFNLFILPDGDTTFQPATTYDLLELDVQFPVTLRIPNADDTAIDGEPIPSTLVTYTGVLGQFSSDDPTVGYQLNPVQADDVEAQEEVTVPVQFIHNAPDPALATIDLYLDGELAFDDFAFRTATSFGDAPADVAFEAAIAPGDSEGPEDAFFTETYTLPSGSAYQFIALGVGEGNFEPNPDGEDIAFTLLLNPDAKLFSETDDTLSDLNFVHGTPDAPAIDVRTSEDIVLYDDVTYGDITDYQPIAPDQAEVEVTAADGENLDKRFAIDLSSRIDEAGTILASGFFTPGNEDDSDGEPLRFGLLVVFADGSSEFVEPIIADDAEEGASIPTAFTLDGNFPNPFADRTTLRYDLPADARVSVEVFDVLGRRVLQVAPEAVAAGAGRTVTLDAALPAGAYLYRLTAEMPTETRTETGRMTVVR